MPRPKFCRLGRRFSSFASHNILTRQTMEILLLLMMIHLVRLGIVLVRKCKFCRCQMELEMTKGLAQVGFHFQVNVSLSVTKTCVPGKVQGEDFSVTFFQRATKKSRQLRFCHKIEPFLSFFWTPWLSSGVWTVRCLWIQDDIWIETRLSFNFAKDWLEQCNDFLFQVLSGQV